MLNVIKIGDKKRDAFVDKCRKNPERFEQPLKRASIHNFAPENLLKKNKSKQIKELVNVRGTLDMFGRLFYLAVRKEMDLNTAFLYPILPEPPCFAYSDGSLKETKKASVLHLMKGNINSSIPGGVNVAIADGMFIIQTSVKDKTNFCSIYQICSIKGFQKFYSDDGVLKFEEIYDLYGYHLEGDTGVLNRSW